MSNQSVEYSVAYRCKGVIYTAGARTRSIGQVKTQLADLSNSYPDTVYFIASREIPVPPPWRDVNWRELKESCLT